MTLQDGLEREWCVKCKGFGKSEPDYYDIVWECSACRGRGWVPVLKEKTQTQSEKSP